MMATISGVSALRWFTCKSRHSRRLRAAMPMGSRVWTFLRISSQRSRPVPDSKETRTSGSRGEASSSPVSPSTAGIVK